MIEIRMPKWPDDREALLALDTSFTTDRVLRVERTEHGFALREEAVAPAIKKTYGLADDVDALSDLEWVRIADRDGAVAGVAAMTYEAWNRRATIRHLYVAPEARGLGVGRALVTAAVASARERDARCVWVETQTVNYGAVRFYTACGFVWCGLDTSLYDLRDVSGDEVALFFARPTA